MSDEEHGPASHVAGYSLEKIYAIEQVLRQVAPEGEEFPEGEPELGLIWDWRIPAVESVVEGMPDSDTVPDFFFEIALGVEISASQERPETGRTILIGRFPFNPQDHSVPLLQFVQLHGVATLYPYLREAVSDLTELSFHGVLYLPIVNVGGLMEPFDLAQSTGWNQLAQQPKLAGGLGIETSEPEEAGGEVVEEGSGD